MPNEPNLWLLPGICLRTEITGVEQAGKASVKGNRMLNHMVTYDHLEWLKTQRFRFKKTWTQHFKKVFLWSVKRNKQCGNVKKYMILWRIPSLSSWSVWDGTWLRAHPSPCCPEETAACLSLFADLILLVSCMNVFCPSLCKRHCCATRWTSLCCRCSPAHLWSEWGRPAEAQPRIPLSLTSQTTPCTLSCRRRE